MALITFVVPKANDVWISRSEAAVGEVGVISGSRAILSLTLLLISSSCILPGSNDPSDGGSQHAEDIPEQSWRFPVSEMGSDLIKSPADSEKFCEKLESSIVKSPIRKASKQLFPGVNFISAVDGHYYYLDYKGERFTVYKNIKTSFDRTLFPNDPYREDAGDFRHHPLTVVPGQSHETPSGLQDVVFGNALAERYYYQAADLPNPFRKTSEVSRANFELLSLAFYAKNGSFDASLMTQDGEVLRVQRFAAELGIRIDTENWLMRYRITAGDNSEIPSFDYGEIELAAEQDILFIYKMGVEGITSYVFHGGKFGVISCKQI